MKKFNLNTLTPLILIFILQGCLPDSLTKFKKDAPQKVSSAATTTAPPQNSVVDQAGNTVTFVPPTMFYYASSGSNTTVGKDVSTSITAVVDGSLGDPQVGSLFARRCDLDLSGNAQTQLLPSGLNLEASNCQIIGTPLTITTVSTPFCSDPTYTSQVTCEAQSFTWNPTTSTCSNPDFQYSTQAACLAGKNKWYKVGSPIPYRVILQSPFLSKPIKTTVNIGTYQPPTQLLYNQTDNLVFKLDTLTNLVTNTEMVNYVRQGLLTSANGITAVVKFLQTSTNTVGVKRVIPLNLQNAAGFVANDFIYSATGAVGKIQNVTGNTVYVEKLYAANHFISGDTVMHSSSYPLLWGDPLIIGPATTISSINTSYLFDMSATNLDNDSQYYTNHFNLSSITRVYQRGVAIDSIVPFATTQISPLNGITFSISPALPPGLVFDPSTGIISGQFTNTIDSYSFTVTASNPVGSVTFPMTLSAIDAPKDLSYTTRELIAVDSFAAFHESEAIFQPITPPLTESITGQILRKYGTNLLSITTVNGQFLQGAVIDSGNAFYSKKATVQANPIFYNVALVVSNSAAAAVGNYASSSTGALGRVVAIDAVSNTLFIQFLNKNAVPFLFKQGDTISFSPTLTTYVASAVTINEVEADNMKLSVSAVAPGMKAGDELTAALSGTPTVGDLGGYVNNIVGSDLYVSDITRRPTQPQYFRTTQVYSNNEKMPTPSAPAGSITAVAHDNFYVVERGVKIEIKPNISIGSGVFYSISPALPSGLTLDSVTGTISGTANFAAARTTYTIAVENLADESKFNLDLEVRDYFKVDQKTATAPSILFHKYGDSRISRKCRINSTDIKNFAAGNPVNTQALDVRCFIDSEEQDLYFNKLKLLSSSGAGACDYIQVYPYSFWQYKPIQSNALTLPPTSQPYVYNTGGCAAAPTPAPTAAALCLGDYESVTGPNCDEGSVQVQVNTWNMNNATPAVCTNTQTTSVLNCGGKKTNCLKGPVRDLLSDTQIQAGWRSMLYSSSAGNSVPSTFSAPFDSFDLTNVRVANGTVNNQCTLTNTDAENWATTFLPSQIDASGIPTMPLGGGANPFYVVNCLDAAKNIKARIRIVVRDWNSAFDITKGIDADLPGSDTSGTGVLAADLMNNNAIVFGKSNNDYMDWDDQYGGAAAMAQTNGVAKSCSSLNAGGEWGNCSDGVSTTQATCIAAGKTWTSTNYHFPGGGI